MERHSDRMARLDGMIADAVIAGLEDSDRRPTMDADGEAAWLAQINRTLAQEDAQEFMAVINLLTLTDCPRVWFAPLGGCFHAEVSYIPAGRARQRRIRAQATTRAGALEALAAAVAARLYPTAGGTSDGR